jgi:hypothetical protein
LGFEPTIPASERVKKVHALDSSATVTGHILVTVLNKVEQLPGREDVGGLNFLDMWPGSYEYGNKSSGYLRSSEFVEQLSEFRVFMKISLYEMSLFKLPTFAHIVGKQIRPLKCCGVKFTVVMNIPVAAEGSPLNIIENALNRVRCITTSTSNRPVMFCGIILSRNLATDLFSERLTD